MVKARACGLVALLISFSLGAWAQPGRYLGEHAGPAALDSPAWRDLMSEPVLQDETLAYHAAGVARAWGHASAADQLRRSLLTLHGRALAGAKHCPRVWGVWAICWVRLRPTTVSSRWPGTQG